MKRRLLTTAVFPLIPMQASQINPQRILSAQSAGLNEVRVCTFELCGLAGVFPTSIAVVQTVYVKSAKSAIIAITRAEISPIAELTFHQPWSLATQVYRNAWPKESFLCPTSMYGHYAVSVIRGYVRKIDGPVSYFSAPIALEQKGRAASNLQHTLRYLCTCIS